MHHNASGAAAERLRNSSKNSAPDSSQGFDKLSPNGVGRRL
jgi:hypothetical protein